MRRCCFRPKPSTLLNCRPLDVKSVNGFAVSCSAALFIVACVTEPQHTTLCVFRHFTHTHNFLFLRDLSSVCVISGTEIFASVHWCDGYGLEQLNLKL